MKDFSKSTPKVYMFILLFYEHTKNNLMSFRHAEKPDSNCTFLEHQCSDGTCLPFTSRCNFVVECPNGDDSDERDCGELWLWASMMKPRMIVWLQP